MLPIRLCLRSSTLKLQYPYANVSKFQSRNLSSGENNSASKSVFISQSSDIYANLALEDWIYANWQFDRKSILFLWKNSPCVVIGRHQNPFVEANMPYLNSASVPVVRRNSGGGTVYHDEGNLNCTFFSSRDRYNRRENLETICKALADLNIHSKINSNDDIVDAHNLKLSGTAAKLGRLAAYHHCTVLVSADITQMKIALQGQKKIKTNATKSIPSSVTNVQSMSDDLNVETVLNSISKNYLRKSLSYESKFSNGITLVNPTEEWFPGLNKHANKMNSWGWLYGMTPKFTVPHKIQLITKNELIRLTVEVIHGIIKEVNIDSPTSKDIEASIKSAFIGLQYSPDIFLHSDTAFQAARYIKSSV